MNISKYDLLNMILKKSEKNQRKLAALTGLSLGKVNSCLRELIEDGYLNEQLEISEQAQKKAEKQRPRHAVILAAGYGMRMVPINVEVPKGLLEIGGERLIERLIRQLREAGVHQIDVVVGFMKERYEYLIDKWNVRLIFNEEYGRKNNLSSLNKVADRIGNSYILPCDIWCRENPFSGYEWYSWYMMTEEESKDSGVRVNRKRELVRVKVEKSGHRMVGIAYIQDQEADRLKQLLGLYASQRTYDQKFWEEVLFAESKMWIASRIAKEEDVYEINTYEQLREIDSHSGHLQTDILEKIAEVLSCKLEEIQEIQALKKGMTNRSFEFSCRGERYIARIPGEGTDRLINRRQEFEVYEALKGTDICDPVVYISPESGYKITKFIENARPCRKENKKEVEDCMRYLKAFHDRKLQVGHTFQLFEQIEYYERLRGDYPSDYEDYEETKKKVFELKAYIDRQPKTIALSHIDAVCDNFLLAPEKMYLIDWEYAGMQDVHVDIAMFAIYAMYSKEEVDWLIACYFQGEPSAAVRVKIYCYIAVCGLLWSNWCEYKKTCGIEFGEYSLRQYRYAKEYYRYAKAEMEAE
ncbi:NTP transferase domain-containing protein [Suipraeoptans intestinalis]|uniref:NTP transferase domain-containing protein n=1 Tax=Suipraeoptans intestinalis TaxID=2606628 RepID=UPI002A74A071|nr:NTP transferase domain-containing protein [Suipraeoptans intestinalis]MDY3122728.1 NTP transferase domain-containing protein [Suipraeoptans intestinalis]